MTDHPPQPNEDPWAVPPPPPPPASAYQAPSPPVPGAPMPGGFQTQLPNESMATSALVCGVIGLCIPLLGIVAIFLGISSIKKIDASMGTLGGKSMATGAIVLGAIGTLTGLMFALR